MNYFQTYNERELLEKVAGGDEQAFGELFYRYSDLLATHIIRLTRSRPVAEEIVQDVFMKIWMTRETLAEVRNFRTWLMVVSKNQALNAIRSIIREREFQKKLEKVYQPGHEMNDEAEAGHLDLLEQAIRNLPPQQQRVWLLSRREGMKHSQIASEMNLSKETIKKYIMIASESITKYLEAY
ncbi:MAG TPA: sigma-70 family RNA polymerase sigma factor, partial [Flavisolibacter sp.]|nr:sigma-70 family RNA polymerase sigma factor [Flavisolibacter sp.]